LGSKKVSGVHDRFKLRDLLRDSGCINRQQLRIRVRRSGAIHRPQFQAAKNVLKLTALGI
jgi:hypothetical protein